MSKFFPAIPEPQLTLESVRAVTLALKEAVELLAGQRGALAPTRAFVQSSPPEARMVGDLWVNTVNRSAVYYWNGSSWVAIQIA